MIGIKIWSTNDFYIDLLKGMYANKVFDYIELFVEPGSLEYIDKWKALDIPFIIHAPHSYAGLNFSQKEMRKGNQLLVDEVCKYFECLLPRYVIYHPGINGEISETIKQINDMSSIYKSLFDISIIENKPAVGIKSEECVGSTVNEIKKIITETSLGFCYDIGHSFCAASSNQVDRWTQMMQFISLGPVMYHLSDGITTSEVDKHLNYGFGDYDLKKIIEMIPDESIISIETNKKSKENLEDFVSDVNFLRSMINERC